MPLSPLTYVFLPVSEAAYEATTTICDVELHTWVGWRMDDLLGDARLAYYTVYFSQGGQWLHIDESKFLVRIYFPLRAN